MRLSLEFQDGALTGDGADQFGRFKVAGTYSVESGKVSFVKQYVGAHAVDYHGFGEVEHEGIWGNWTIRRLDRGGFRIWPDPDLAAARQETTESVENGEAVPVVAPGGA